MSIAILAQAPLCRGQTHASYFLSDAPDKFTTPISQISEIKKNSFFKVNFFPLIPLLNDLFFSSFFGTQPKIGSFRLPTHSRDAH